MSWEKTARIEIIIEQLQKLKELKTFNYKDYQKIQRKIEDLKK